MSDTRAGAIIDRSGISERYTSHSEKFVYCTWRPALWTRPSAPSYSPLSSLNTLGSRRQWYSAV